MNLYAGVAQSLYSIVKLVACELIAAYDLRQYRADFRLHQIYVGAVNRTVDGYIFAEARCIYRLTYFRLCQCHIIGRHRTGFVGIAKKHSHWNTYVVRAGSVADTRERNADSLSIRHSGEIYRYFRATHDIAA